MALPTGWTYVELNNTPISLTLSASGATRVYLDSTIWGTDNWSGSLTGPIVVGTDYDVGAMQDGATTQSGINGITLIGRGFYIGSPTPPDTTYWQQIAEFSSVFPQYGLQGTCIRSTCGYMATPPYISSWGTWENFSVTFGPIKVATDGSSYKFVADTDTKRITTFLGITNEEVAMGGDPLYTTTTVLTSGAPALNISGSATGTSNVPMQFKDLKASIGVPSGAQFTFTPDPSHSMTPITVKEIREPGTTLVQWDFSDGVATTDSTSHDANGSKWYTVDWTEDCTKAVASDVLRWDQPCRMTVAGPGALTTIDTTNFEALGYHLRTTGVGSCEGIVGESGSYGHLVQAAACPSLDKTLNIFKSVITDTANYQSIGFVGHEHNLVSGHYVETSSWGNIGSYLWDFGDGSSTSNTMNPTHLYSTGGAKTVTLTVSHAVTGATDTSIKMITVEQPSISFTVVQNGSTLKFTPVYPCVGITSILWTFEDGTTSTDLSPERLYREPGQYQTRLDMTLACGIGYYVGLAGVEVPIVSEMPDTNGYLVPVAEVSSAFCRYGRMCFALLRYLTNKHLGAAITGDTELPGDELDSSINAGYRRVMTDWPQISRWYHVTVPANENMVTLPEDAIDVRFVFGTGQALVQASRMELNAFNSGWRDAIGVSASTHYTAIDSTTLAVYPRCSTAQTLEIFSHVIPIVGAVGDQTKILMNDADIPQFSPISAHMLIVYYAVADFASKWPMFFSKTPDIAANALEKYAAGLKMYQNWSRDNSEGSAYKSNIIDTKAKPSWVKV